MIQWHRHTRRQTHKRPCPAAADSRTSAQIGQSLCEPQLSACSGAASVALARARSRARGRGRAAAAAAAACALSAERLDLRALPWSWSRHPAVVGNAVVVVVAADGACARFSAHSSVFLRKVTHSSCRPARGEHAGCCLCANTVLKLHSFRPLRVHSQPDPVQFWRAQPASSVPRRPLRAHVVWLHGVTFNGASRSLSLWGSPMGAQIFAPSPEEGGRAGECARRRRRYAAPSVGPLPRAALARRGSKKRDLSPFRQGAPPKAPSLRGLQQEGATSFKLHLARLLHLPT